VLEAQIKVENTEEVQGVDNNATLVPDCTEILCSIP
jgi:hypothetical protein